MPKILGWRRPGKIGRRWLFIYSPIAQSVERVTVNHDVVGSSPTWGASKKRRYTNVYLLFFTLFVVGREQDGDCITIITTIAEVATNNLNGCWLVRGRLLRRVQLGEPVKEEDTQMRIFFFYLVIGSLELIHHNFLIFA